MIETSNDWLELTSTRKFYEVIDFLEANEQIRKLPSRIGQFPDCKQRPDIIIELNVSNIELDDLAILHPNISKKFNKNISKQLKRGKIERNFEPCVGTSESKFFQKFIFVICLWHEF